MIFQRSLRGFEGILQRADKLGLWLTNILLIGSLLVLSILPFLAYQWMQVPFMGAFVEQTLVFNSVKPQGDVPWLGIRAGLEYPNQLFEIEGEAVKNTRELSDILAQFSPGDQIEIVYGMQDEILRADIRLQKFPASDLLAFFYVPYLIGWAYLLIGIWVFRARWHSLAGRTFMIFCASMSLSIGTLFDLYTTHVFSWLWSLSLAVAPASLFTLGLIFPKEAPWSEKFPALRWVGFIPAFILILFSEWALYLATDPIAYISAWQWEYFFASLSILFFLGMAFYRHLRAKAVIVRDQARVILLGSLLAFSPITYYMIRAAVEPLAFNVSIFFPPLGFFPLAIGYAILRHRLLDTDRLIRQSVAYIILAVIVGAGYVFLTNIAHSLSGIVMPSGNSIFILGSVITIVLILIFNPLRVWVQDNVEQLFIRQNRDLRERIWEFSNLLKRAVDFEQIVSALHHVLEDTVQPSQAYLFARDRFNGCFRFYGIIGENNLSSDEFECVDDSPLVRFLERQEKGTVFLADEENMPPELIVEWDRLEKLNVQVFFPFSSQSGLTGWLAIAESLTGEAYSREDLVFVESLGHQVATAIERAWLFVAEKEKQNVVEALKDAAAALTSTLDLELVLDRILTNVKKVVPHEGINIMLIEGDIVRVVRRQGDEEYAGEARVTAVLNRKHPVDKTPSLIHMMKTRQPEIIYDTSERSDWVDLPESRWVRSYLGTPIRNKGEVIGFLNLNSDKPNFFTKAHAENLLAFADQAGAAIENSRLFNGLQKANKDLLAAYDTTLEGWVRALDLRDKETEGHSQRVTRITLALAEALGLSDEDLLHIKRGALLHDIGKIGVSDTILHKAGPLTDHERKIMCLHPIYSYEMLSAIEFLHPAMDIPYCHHERWDGTGYPRGLAGKNIPLAARIFAIVDVWDALVSDRPYRKAMPPNDVIAYLREEAGTHFDPSLIEPFVNLPEIQRALQKE